MPEHQNSGQGNDEGLSRFKEIVMEYASEGTLGAYEAIDGLGSMAGGLLGGAIPAIYDFNVLFIVCSAIFATALLASSRI